MLIDFDHGRYDIEQSADNRSTTTHSGEPASYLNDWDGLQLKTRLIDLPEIIFSGYNFAFLISVDCRAPGFFSRCSSLWAVGISLFKPASTPEIGLPGVVSVSTTPKTIHEDTVLETAAVVSGPTEPPITLPMIQSRSELAAAAGIELQSLRLYRQDPTNLHVAPVFGTPAAFAAVVAPVWSERIAGSGFEQPTAGQQHAAQGCAA